MKKVVFITTRPIYPITGGREVVLYNYCKGLSEMHNCEVDLISFIDDENYNLTPDFINSQYIVKTPSKIEKVKNLVIKSLILKKWPLQVSLYYSRKTQRNIEKIINKINPDILICDMARTAEYIRNITGFSGKKVLDMDDLLSKRYFRQANNVSKDNNILGQYGNKIPGFVKKMLSSTFIKKKVLLLEGNLLQRYELEVSKDFNHIIFVSQIEAKELNEKMNKNKAFDVSIGVDHEYYSKIVVEKKQENLIGFLGNMYIPHNQDAVMHFINDIFPRVKEEIPNAKFRIIGKCSKEYKEQFEDREDIEVTGQVEDIRQYMQECIVAVAPLTYGSGIKTKILETMAMGVPVVTNDIGAEGIKIKNGQNIIISNNNYDYANNVVLLLKDLELNQSISNNGKESINMLYTWDETLKNLEICCDLERV